VHIEEVPEERWKRHLDACRRLEAGGSDVEGILLFLRRNGASKIESMRVLMELIGLSNELAKLVVHHSNTWRDTRCSDERLHEQFQSMVVATLRRRRQE
jgi:hypothetical protein